MRCNDKPFGGIQLILCGDFLQLPPVSRNDNGAEGQATFCFQSEAWDRCNFSCFELTVVHRQSDPVFIDILQNIRIGRCVYHLKQISDNDLYYVLKFFQIKILFSLCRVTPEIVDRLQATMNNKVDQLGILASRLCSLTKESQLINVSKLEQLAGK